MAFNREEYEKMCREEIEREDSMDYDKRRFYDTGHFWVMVLVIIVTVPIILPGIAYWLFN